jgi:hypothetical protein
MAGLLTFFRRAGKDAASCSKLVERLSMTGQKRRMAFLEDRRLKKRVALLDEIGRRVERGTEDAVLGDVMGSLQPLLRDSSAPASAPTRTVSDAAFATFSRCVERASSRTLGLYTFGFLDTLFHRIAGATPKDPNLRQHYWDFLWAHTDAFLDPYMIGGRMDDLVKGLTGPDARNYARVAFRVASPMLSDPRFQTSRAYLTGRLAGIVPVLLDHADSAVRQRGVLLFHTLDRANMNVDAARLQIEALAASEPETALRALAAHVGKRAAARRAKREAPAPH